MEEVPCKPRPRSNSSPFDVDGTPVEHPEGRVIWQLLNHRFTGSDDRRPSLPRLRRRPHRLRTLGAISDVEGWIQGGAEPRGHSRGGAEAPSHRGRDGRASFTSRSRLSPGRHQRHARRRDRRTLPDHPSESVFTNKLHFHEDGQLASWEATATHTMEGKARALELLAEQAGIPLRAARVRRRSPERRAGIAPRGYSVAFN